MAELYQTDTTAYYSPARSGEVRISVGDPRRAAEQLGFKAETVLADGLAITLDLPCTRFEMKPRVVA
jgi:GDP-D-mannose dehydratase